jgi:hypothetical protein
MNASQSAAVPGRQLEGNRARGYVREGRVIVARVVPSQVVAAIDRLFGWAAGQLDGGERIQLYGRNSPQLAAIIDLVERLPDEVLVLDAEDVTTLRVCVVALREQILRWQAHGDHAYSSIPGFSNLNPVTLIRRVVAKCPDEGPQSGTTELAYIKDKQLRDSIRLDMSAAHRNLAEAEWKGATVLAGAAVEALLLWALQHRQKKKPQDVVGAVSGALKQNPGADLEGQAWHLHEYIEVAAYLKLVGEDTAKLVRLAKDFRNLIHPGRAARLRQKCDRATAHGAIAAMEAVARDLARR